VRLLGADQRGADCESAARLFDHFTVSSLTASARAISWFGRSVLIGVTSWLRAIANS
jgi:hypothetical protein